MHSCNTVLRGAGLSKTVMNTSMRYALNKGKISDNPAIDVSLPKSVKAKAYHTRTIKESHTSVFETISA